MHCMGNEATKQYEPSHREIKFHPPGWRLATPWCWARVHPPKPGVLVCCISVPINGFSALSSCPFLPWLLLPLLLSFPTFSWKNATRNFHEVQDTNFILLYTLTTTPPPYCPIFSLFLFLFFHVGILPYNCDTMEGGRECRVFCSCKLDERFPSISVIFIRVVAWWIGQYLNSTLIHLYF